MERIRSEAGETLVELLITLLVISVGLVAIVGAMGSSIIASDAGQNMAMGEVVVRDVGEIVKRTSATLPICPTVDDVNTAIATYLPAYETPPGWTATVKTVEYRAGSGSDANGFSSDRNDCMTEVNNCIVVVPACDSALRRVTIEATNARDDYAKEAVTGRLLVRRGNP